MRALFRMLLLVVGLSCSSAASASIWSWIDSLTTCTAATYCYDYQFTVADWDQSDSTPNPCYGLTACTLFISHRHDAAGTSGTGVVRSWGSGAYPFLTTTETMGELGKALSSVFSLPFSSTTNHQSISPGATEECVGFFYAPGKDLGTNASPVVNESFKSFPLMPGSICGAAPAPSGSCDFDQDTLTLDHGTLSRRELEGHEVQESVSISCSTTETLKIFIYSADRLELRDDGSLYSELYMNDTILGTTGLTIEVSDNTVVDVKSILRTNGSVAAGEFSGSTVMLITVE